MSTQSAQSVYRPHRKGAFTKEQIDLFDNDAHHQVDTRGLRKYLQGSEGITVELEDGDTVIIKADGFYTVDLDTTDPRGYVHAPYPTALFSVVIPVGFGKLAFTFRLENFDRDGKKRAKPHVMVF